MAQNTNTVVFKMVIAFVAIIIAVALIPVVADLSNDKSEKIVIADESVDVTTAKLGGNQINESVIFTVTNNPTSWKTSECPLTSVTLSNSSTDLTVTTDYLFTAASGTFNLVNSTATVGSLDNTTLADYTYCGDDYLTQSWSRTLIKLIAGFLVLALLVSIAIGFAVSAIQESTGKG